MSKILVFTDRTPHAGDPFSSLVWNQLEQLAQSQNDVTVVTHSDGDEAFDDIPGRIQVLRPWRHWGPLNLPKLLFLLQAERPDWLHLIEPLDSGEFWGLSDRFHVLNIIAVLEMMRPRPKISVQLFHPRAAKRSSLVKTWVEKSDRVFVSNREMFGPVLHSPAEVMEAPFVFDGLKSTPEHWLQDWLEEYIFVPADLEEFVDFEALKSRLRRELIPRPQLQAVLLYRRESTRRRYQPDLARLGLLDRIAFVNDISDGNGWLWLLKNARAVVSDGLASDSGYTALLNQWLKSTPQLDNFWSRAFAK